MRKMVVIAGLLATPAGTVLESPLQAQNPTPLGPIPKADPRLAQLDAFFAQCDCPVRSMAGDFLVASDSNGLDWRLLPSISLVESGGGKNYRNNNIFGWDSGRARFPSVRAGIHAVAERLGQSKRYRHKTAVQILKTYNPRPDYLGRVTLVMRTLSMN